ncbi:hypothetical protein EEJ42_11890 [Streptomyces botrytidirepellens]|uniref:Uncharacterized protein n=1 Tax=Streptomyces botrytidirepellens TaxID=2486417 RepID=A0A3M8WFE8_9ACTN|nr:hypothetical protein EEJ42_11890 [Streptomyces botrytidirepellens]
MSEIFTWLVGLPAASVFHTSKVRLDLSPSASVTVLRSTVFDVMARQMPSVCLKVGPAEGLLPDTGRLPAARGLASGPAAGRDEGA